MGKMKGFLNAEKVQRKALLLMEATTDAYLGRWND
jgi:hypothetical protein